MSDPLTATHIDLQPIHKFTFQYGSFRKPSPS